MNMKNMEVSSRKLSLRELQMIAASTGDQYVTTIYQTDAGFWTFKVKLKEKEIALAIETTRGGLKVWRNVLNAILYVQKNCQFASEVFVQISDWTLVRLNPEKHAKKIQSN